MRSAALALLVAAASAHAEAPARIRRLTIVGVNDIHGALLAAKPARGRDPIGGAEWFAGYVQAVRAQARSEGSEAIVVDAGDEFQGTLVSNQFQGRSVVEVLNAIGVAAAAVGNHEFDFGLDVLRDRMAQARYPILLANVFQKGTRRRPPWARPSVLLDVSGVKVGVVGLATVETPTVTNPLVVEGLEFVPCGPIAAEEAAALRARGATVVIVAAHAGPLGPGREIQGVAEAVRGKVDAIVSGHNHISLGPPPFVWAGIPIVQSGAKLTAFSVIDLALDEQGRATGFAVNQGTTPKEGGPQVLFHSWGGALPRWRGREVKPDAEVAAIVRKYDAQVEELRKTRVGESEVELRKGGRDGLLGNFVADALRSGAGGSLSARFALQNSGGLRVSELGPGPLTFGDLFDLFPFDNRQVVVTVPLPTLRDALETVLRRGKQPLQVSGLRYTVEWERFAGTDRLHAPPGALVARIVDEGTGEVLCQTKSCTAGSCDAPCAPGRYTVSTTDFLANGGDGLSMLKDAPRKDGGMLARDVVVSFVKAHSPITAQLVGGSPRVTVNGSPPRGHYEVQ
jgi:5'-nucleotidase